MKKEKHTDTHIGRFVDDIFFVALITSTHKPTKEFSDKCRWYERRVGMNRRYMKEEV